MAEGKVRFFVSLRLALFSGQEKFVLSALVLFVGFSRRPLVSKLANPDLPVLDLRGWRCASVDGRSKPLPQGTTRSGCAT